MSAFEQMLTQEPAGKLAVGLVDRIIQSFDSSEEKGPNAPIDALLMTLAMLLEPNDALRDEQDFVNVCTNLGNRLLIFLKGSREFRETIGQSPVHLVTEGLIRSSSDPGPGEA